MSTTKTREQLVRLSWLTELRRQGDRQCEGTFSKGRYVCALGLLIEVAVPRREWGSAHWDDTDRVGALAGLSPKQSTDIALRNDGEYAEKHTFSEIADVVAGWFPND